MEKGFQNSHGARPVNQEKTSSRCGGFGPLGCPKKISLSRMEHGGQGPLASSPRLSVSPIPSTPSPFMPQHLSDVSSCGEDTLSLSHKHTHTHTVTVAHPVTHTVTHTHVLRRGATEDHSPLKHGLLSFTENLQGGADPLALRFRVQRRPAAKSK